MKKRDTFFLKLLGMVILAMSSYAVNAALLNCTGIGGGLVLSFDTANDQVKFTDGEHRYEVSKRDAFYLISYDYELDKRIYKEKFTIERFSGKFSINGSVLGRCEAATKPKF